MTSPFHKISRVRSIAGATKWYLSDDCLLAAKRTMYVVEYRRFFLRDLEWVMVWRSRAWLFRVIVPAVLLAAFGFFLWLWTYPTAGAIFMGLAVAWVLLELLLGPTAKSRVRVTGTSVDLPLVKRMRRADKVLAKIDQAVRAARVAAESSVSMGDQRSAGGALSATVHSEAASAVPALADVTQTNAF